MIQCRACLMGGCPVHQGIRTPEPLREVHWAGCRDTTCTGCLPPQWVEWDRQARAATEARR